MYESEIIHSDFLHHQFVLMIYDTCHDINIIFQKIKLNKVRQNNISNLLRKFRISLNLKFERWFSPMFHNSCVDEGKTEI